MDKATKAALFSALLFPGWGQFYLKRYLRGLVFLVPVLAGTVFLAWTIIQAGRESMKELTSRNGILLWDDFVQITLGTLKAINGYDFLIAMVLIVTLWIMSILDAYQIGKINN